MERIEYGRLLGENLSEDECMRLFGISKEDFLDDNYKWTQSLEVAYQEFMDNQMSDDMIGDYAVNEDDNF